jgi:hypothetical protein
MFAEFMVESFYSRARRGNRRIAGYVTVSATPLSDKMADQKTANVTARSIEALIIELVKALLKAGSLSATVMPLLTDHNIPSEYFDPTEQRWHTARESIKSYYPRKDTKNVT